MSRETRRRFVPLPEKLIEEAFKVSERVGIPYLVLIERVLESNLAIMKYKPSLLEALMVVDAIDDMRKLGAVIVPWRLAKLMIENSDEATFNNLLDEMSRLSLWFGELVRVKRGSSPRIFESALSSTLSFGFIDLIQEDGGTYKCVISFLDSSPRVLQLAEVIVTGLAKGLNLKIYDVKRSDNTVTLRIGDFYEKD